jgi:aspartate-semialdehyde dehydrogenase
VPFERITTQHYLKGMEELKVGTALKLEGNPVPNKVFVHPLPFNLIPHIDSFQVTCTVC